MKAVKLVILSVVTTVIMAVSWAVGTQAGNAITQSAPPAPTDPADAAKVGLAFLAVCAFNAILITLLTHTTSTYTGRGRQIALVLFVFAIQFLLPQMETFFFARSIGIGYDQATAILIAGVVVSIVTVLLAINAHPKLVGAAPGGVPLKVSYPVNRKSLMLLGLLIVVVYPVLYMTFGYYIAWQNEHLRVFYTDSTVLESYWYQLGDSFSTGIYFFQVLRAFIWVLVTVPVAMMLRERAVVQFMVVGTLTALLPTSLLFIPNPFMPWEVAMTHFVETSTSNFVWGLIVVWAVRITNKQL